MARIFWISFVLLHTSSATTLSYTSHELEDKIDTFIEPILTCRDIASMNVAIVHRGEVLLTKGYGSTRLEDGEPVTDHTLFGVASVTKAFTTTLLGLLLEESEVFVYFYINNY